MLIGSFSFRLFNHFFQKPQPGDRTSSEVSGFGDPSYRRLKFRQFSVGWVERSPTTKRYQHKETYPFGDMSVAEKPRETQHAQLSR